MISVPYLRPRVKQAIFYRVVLGLSRKETAQIMGISSFTVRNYERDAESAFNARNWHQLGALVVACGLFQTETVLEAQEAGYPPLYSILNPLTKSVEGK